MIDPYDIIGVARDANTASIKAAYRRRAKTAHPDSGGDVDAFAQLKAAYELLLDPVRRKVYDDTGYDPELADTKDLKGLMVLEKLINEVILDEREPGSFDPIATIRRKLTNEVVNARFHIMEMERHRARIRNHMDRVGKRPTTDVFGSMLRARSEAIAEAIEKAEAQIKDIEQAYGMLDGYSYDVEVEIETRNAAE